jgi:hypothetical protein
MDGRFVPGIAIIPVVIEAIRRATKKPLDVRLTMVEPDACGMTRAMPTPIGCWDGASRVDDALPVPPALVGCKADVAQDPGSPIAFVENVPFCSGDHAGAIARLREHERPEA